jgi:hypothetical protein
MFRLPREFQSYHFVCKGRMTLSDLVKSEVIHDPVTAHQIHRNASSSSRWTMTKIVACGVRLGHRSFEDNQNAI